LRSALARFPRRSLCHMSEIQYPSDTAVFYDGTYAFPVGACRIGDTLPVDPRHTAKVNVLWADFHVKVLSAERNGTSCTTMDGKPIEQFALTDAAPYHGKRSLHGI